MGKKSRKAEESVVDENDVVPSTEQKKKEKKKKKQSHDLGEEPPLETSLVEKDADSEAKKEKKKNKKDKKRQREAVDTQDNDDSEQVSKKKKKSSGEDSDSDTVAVADDEQKKEKKKKKKNKSKDSQDDVPSTSGGQGGVAPYYYQEHEEIVKMSATEVSAYRDGLVMAVEGKGAFKPVIKFEHAGFPPKLLLSCKNFAKPSPIQSQAWPIIMSGKDMIGLASTGSGKTLAFGLPGMMHALTTKCKPCEPCFAAIAPTRELAVQIAEVLAEAGKPAGIYTAVVYGGMPKWEQKKALQSASIVVATPGRLQDLMSEGAVSLAKVTYMVLDEADRMLDLGFEKDIRKIFAELKSPHQTCLFSATWPREAAQLAGDFLKPDVMKVTIGSRDLSASHTVTQLVDVVEMQDRDRLIHDLLSKYHRSKKNRVLVFVLYKKEAPRLEQTLLRKGWTAVAIHGDMTQNARQNAVNGFKDGSTPLLIATDVAARGLDIPDVEYVINYSFPLTVEDYVHRIGRTGRAGKTGTAHTFFTQADKPRAGELVNVLREAGATVPEGLLKFGTHVKKKESKLYGAHFKDVDMDAKATKITFDDDE